MFRYCRLLTNVCQFQLQLTKGFNEAVIMSQDIGKNKNKVYKVVLTGGNVKPSKSYIQTRNMTISSDRMHARGYNFYILWLCKTFDFPFSVFLTVGSKK